MNSQFLTHHWKGLSITIFVIAILIIIIVDIEPHQSIADRVNNAYDVIAAVSAISAIVGFAVHLVNREKESTVKAVREFATNVKPKMIESEKLVESVNEPFSRYMFEYSESNVHEKNKFHKSRRINVKNDSEKFAFSKSCDYLEEWAFNVDNGLVSSKGVFKDEKVRYDYVKYINTFRDILNPILKNSKNRYNEILKIYDMINTGDDRYGNKKK